MTISTLPLSYCTNVHPGRSVEEVERGLDEYTLPISQRFGSTLAAGLWLARPVVDELIATPEALSRFADGLRQRRLVCHTLNAFPYGDFHSDRVKENVYVPDWTQPERLEYTANCARVLTTLLPEGVEGSLSTVPLGFKNFDHPASFLDGCIAQLLELANRLEALRQETGKTVRLAIEPEPLCLLETTQETVGFFDRLREQAADAGMLQQAQQYLGVCYDVCHQAVEFEDVAESIRVLRQNEVRINKVHITCAIELDHPAENVAGREALVRYVEPRYLHQTLARMRGGEIARCADLTEQLSLTPSDEFLDAEMWRIHFHVPVDAEQLGPLKTTRAELERALIAVAQLDYAPHLELETYTWEVLPGGTPADLVEGLTRELVATRELLTELNSTPA